MMKKISKALFLCGIVVVLAACGQEATSTGNLAQNINIGASSSGNAGKVDDKEVGDTEKSDQKNSQKEEGVFSFAYNGASLVPGELVDHSALPKYTDVAEVPSCAFGGNDNVYDFKLFELTTHVDGEEECIYSIYFVDPNLPTTEGLRLGDTVDDMISLYGEDYEAEENVYAYKRGETSLNMITKNDIVVSIEYRLDR